MTQQLKPASSVRVASVWLAKAWPIVAVATGLTSWLAFAKLPSQSVPLLCCPAAIAMVGVGATAYAMRKINTRITRAVGILLTTLLIAFWVRYDSYDVTWGQRTIRYTDTFTRWGDEQIYRRVDGYESIERLGEPIWTEQGPVSKPETPHGKWLTTTSLPNSPVKTKFYWHGERITEDEWNLRQ